ncbi:MAG: hypothetical protein AUI50_08745 [Crenarchaeota archaeon 13_1_40CM_2_52_14]|nr:MAG: hypothetical protein AUI97_06545 [Crenarchaeota archaeon 13_1_40CM_3_52_17]OLD33915.1 MAG: hypothetical protein AUI50_08745 [Crenarchaeota archaeon 13_1_40CM_2_52_14]OLE71867.1 MAG: hypothetical protein AUF78_00070 [archaeon 13_1_20CM_2_51_12]
MRCPRSAGGASKKKIDQYNRWFENWMKGMLDDNGTRFRKAKDRSGIRRWIPDYRSGFTASSHDFVQAWLLLFRWEGWTG